jgi:glutaredoxin
MKASANLPILYIKPGCPWCREARAFLDNLGVAYDLRDVTRSAQNMQRMLEVSGQGLTPTLEYGEFVCVDFSTDELQDALSEHPDVRRDLGIADDL